MKRALKRALWRLFVAGQRLGVDVLPRHFYSEIPDIRRLRRSTQWRAPYSMTGVAGADVDRQLDFARAVMSPEDRQSGVAYERACADNGVAGYGVAEAQFLFRYIAHVCPRRVVQVGAGVSTSIMLQAAASAGHALHMIAIDPFPTGYLRNLAAAGTITLIDKPAESLETRPAEQLERGDLLFIDSTHTLGPAGEVARLVLEWLPRLKPGVDVHFHDIMFPYDYMPDVLDGAMFFPHESALLHAFLCLNPHFEIRCSLSMLHHARDGALAELLPSYRPPQTADGLVQGGGSIPSAIYLTRVA